MGDTLEEYLAAVNKNQPPTEPPQEQKPFLSDKWEGMWNQDVTQRSKNPALARILGKPLSRYGGALEAMGNEISKPLSPAWTTPIGDVAKRGPVGVASTGLEMLGDTLGRLINTPIAGGRELLGKDISNMLADAYNYSGAALRQDEANMQNKINSVRGTEPKQFSGNPSFQEIYPQSKPNENLMDFMRYLAFTVKNDPATWMFAGAGPAKSLAGEALSGGAKALSGAQNFVRAKQAASAAKAAGPAPAWMNAPIPKQPGRPVPSAFQMPDEEMISNFEKTMAKNGYTRPSNSGDVLKWAQEGSAAPSAAPMTTEDKALIDMFDQLMNENRGYQQHLLNQQRLYSKQPVTIEDVIQQRNPWMVE